MKAFHLSILAMLALGACAPLQHDSATPVDLYKPDIPSAAEVRNRLVGYWYGEAPLKGGGLRQWKVDRSADGTYRITFRFMPADQPVEESVEAGFWGAAGPVYFTMTRGWMDGDSFMPADASDASLYDAYEITSLTDSEFSYRNLQTGNAYTLRRVSDSFPFPELRGRE